MDVLKNNREYISSRVSAETLAENLYDSGYINGYNYGMICTQETQHLQMFDSLLDALLEGGDTEGIYYIWEIIRERYPHVSANIHEIQMGVRMKVPIGEMKVLTVAGYGCDIGVDIRQYEVGLNSYFYNKQYMHQLKE